MGEYVTLGPMEMYYETAGDEGDPILFLHGGGGGAFVWEPHMAHFAPSHRVFASEQRGRAHTADVEGPISYEMMAGDTLALVDKVIGEPVHVVGASDGGDIGLLMAMERPEMVRSLVSIGGNYHHDAIPPGFLEMGPDDEALEMPRQMYVEMSPDGPDHFAVVFDKLKQMWREEPELTTDDLASIETPVLVMAGDADLIPLSHTVSMFEGLANAQLAIVPGASHAVFMEKPDLVNRLIEDFIGS